MKKTVIAMLILATVASSNTVTYAQEVATNNIQENEIKEILNQHGFEIIEVSNDTTNLKKFNTKEELENYLDSIEKISKNNSNQVEIIKTQAPLSRAAASVQNDTHLFNWYNPFAGFDGITLFCWNNINIKYSYKKVSGKSQFVSVDSVDSYLTGISLTWWQQINYSTRISTTRFTKDTLKVTVNGNYVLGVQMGSFTLGAKRGDSWTKSFRIM